MKEYTFTYNITGVIFPEDDLEGLSYEEIQEALTEAYESADCKDAYDIDGEPIVDCEWFRVYARYSATVKANSEEEAKVLANEKLDEADFGDIRDIDWELLEVEVEKAKEETKGEER